MITFAKVVIWLVFVATAVLFALTLPTDNFEWWQSVIIGFCIGYSASALGRFVGRMLAGEDD